MIELRQQKERGLRGLPLEVDRVYRDGKAVGLIGRYPGAALQLFRRFTGVEREAIREGVTECRGEFGEVAEVVEPQTQSRLKALRQKLKKAGQDE